MCYKTNVAENVRLKEKYIRDKFNQDVTIKLSSSLRRRNYSEDEIQKLIELKGEGKTDQYIADELGRTY